MANNSNQKKTNKANQNKPRKGYVSPLTDELSLNTVSVGSGVELYHDRSTNHLLLDVDVGTRRGISLSGKTVKIATASYVVEDKKKLSINVFDKTMTDEELDQLDDFLARKEREKNLAQRRKSLE